MGPTVAASLRAGRHTATRRPARAATSAATSKSPVVEAAQGGGACLVRSRAHPPIIPHPGPGHARTPRH